MKWLRLRREITYSTGRLDVIRYVIGWTCSSCQHTHWESDERPGKPEGGCWLCHERDTERGSDAPHEGPRGREVLGRLT